MIPSNDLTPPVRRQSPDGSGPTPNKRRRTALACNSCRYRKSRCNGDQPVCSTCSEMGFECVYRRPVNANNSSSQKQPASRQVQPTSESRLESRLQAVEELLRSLAGERLPPSSGLDSAQAQLNDNGYSQDRSDGTGQLQEDTVDGMGVIIFADEAATTGYFGPTSNTALFSHIARALASTANYSNSIHGSDNHREMGATLSRPVSRPASPPRQQVADGINPYILPSRSKMLHLVETFFSRTGSMFPYIHKVSIITSVEQLVLDDFAGARKSWLCLLNGILAIGTSLDDESCESVNHRDQESEVFLQRALMLSPWTISNTANLETLQGLTVLTQYLQGTSRSAQTWRLHGLLVQAAFQMGIHNSEGPEKCSALEQEIRTRTWYTCVVIDRMLSMTFGRPHLIHDDYLQARLPLDIELGELSNRTEEHSQPDFTGTSSASLFIASITLYRALSQIIRDIYNHNIVSSQRVRSLSRLDKIVNLERKLSEWNESLPPALQLINEEDLHRSRPQDWPFTRSQTILTIRYLHVHFLLHRSVLEECLDCVAGESPTPSSLPFLDGMLKTCSQSAVRLITIIHVVAQRPELLPAWWFSAYHVFSASLVVFGLVVIQTVGDITVSETSPAALLSALRTAQDALGKIGRDTRLVRRCLKYLRKVLQIATTLVRNHTSGILTARDVPTTDSRVHFESIGTAATDETSNSPLDMEFGQFLVDGDFDFLNAWAGVNQDLG